LITQKDAKGVFLHISFDMCRWTCAVTDSRNDMCADKVRENIGVSCEQWREADVKVVKLQQESLRAE
jgi:integrase/recombinase XerD